jgi:uncharacterized membrane protein YphA (DoxX/SURF4 family)
VVRRCFFWLFTVGESCWALFLVIGSGRLSSWGFADQIAKVGFPASVPLAIFVALCESVSALLIVLGFFTRISALLVALSMSGALYFSLRMGEASWHLAGLYGLAFLGLALTGPGKFSIDYVVRTPFIGRRENAGSEDEPKALNAGEKERLNQ